MPVSRHRKRQSNPQKRKRLEAKRQLREMAHRVTHQAVLDHVLLAEKDPVKRMAMFQCIRPYLKFAAVFPSKLDRVPAKTLAKPIPYGEGSGLLVPR